MLLLHTCFFFGGEISAVFIHVGFQLKISNPCRRFFGTARKGFAVCMHPCFRRWVPRKPCSSKLKKRGRGHENFRWWLKFLEHDLNIIFPWSFVFYLTLYLKRWSMIFFLISFYMLLVIGCIFLPLRWYWLEVCLDSRRKPRCGRRTFPCFEARGSRMSHHGKSYSDTDGLQEMRPQIFGVLVFASKLLAQDSHMYFEFIM